MDRAFDRRGSDTADLPKSPDELDARVARIGLELQQQGRSGICFEPCKHGLVSIHREQQRIGIAARVTCPTGE